MELFPASVVYYGMTVTLGAAAEIVVKDPQVLDEPLLHRIPNQALLQRLRLWAALEARPWVVR